MRLISIDVTDIVLLFLIEKTRPRRVYLIHSIYVVYTHLSTSVNTYNSNIIFPKLQLVLQV